MSNPNEITSNDHLLTTPESVSALLISVQHQLTNLLAAPESATELLELVQRLLLPARTKAVRLIDGALYRLEQLRIQDPSPATLEWILKTKSILQKSSDNPYRRIQNAQKALTERLNTIPLILQIHQKLTDSNLSPRSRLDNTLALLKNLSFDSRMSALRQRLLQARTLQIRMVNTQLHEFFRLFEGNETTLEDVEFWFSKGYMETPALNSLLDIAREQWHQLVDTADRNAGIQDILAAEEPKETALVQQTLREFYALMTPGEAAVVMTNLLERNSPWLESNIEAALAALQACRGNEHLLPIKEILSRQGSTVLLIEEARSQLKSIPDGQGTLQEIKKLLHIPIWQPDSRLDEARAFTGIHTFLEQFPQQIKNPDVLQAIFTLRAILLQRHHLLSPVHGKIPSLEHKSHLNLVQQLNHRLDPVIQSVLPQSRQDFLWDISRESPTIATFLLNRALQGEHPDILGALIQTIRDLSLSEQAEVPLRHLSVNLLEGISAQLGQDLDKQLRHLFLDNSLIFICPQPGAIHPLVLLARMRNELVARGVKTIYFNCPIALQGALNTYASQKDPASLSEELITWAQQEGSDIQAALQAMHSVRHQIKLVATQDNRMLHIYAIKLSFYSRPDEAPVQTGKRAIVITNDRVFSEPWGWAKLHNVPVYTLSEITNGRLLFSVIQEENTTAQYTATNSWKKPAWVQDGIVLPDAIRLLPEGLRREATADNFGFGLFTDNDYRFLIQLEDVPSLADGAVKFENLRDQQTGRQPVEILLFLSKDKDGKPRFFWRTRAETGWMGAEFASPDEAIKFLQQAWTDPVRIHSYLLGITRETAEGNLEFAGDSAKTLIERLGRLESLLQENSLLLPERQLHFINPLVRESFDEPDSDEDSSSDDSLLFLREERFKYQFHRNRVHLRTQVPVINPDNDHPLSQAFWNAFSQEDKNTAAWQHLKESIESFWEFREEISGHLNQGIEEFHASVLVWQALDAFITSNPHTSVIVQEQKNRMESRLNFPQGETVQQDIRTLLREISSGNQNVLDHFLHAFEAFRQKIAAGHERDIAVNATILYRQLDAHMKVLKAEGGHEKAITLAETMHQHLLERILLIDDDTDSELVQLQADFALKAEHNPGLRNRTSVLYFIKPVPGVIDPRIPLSAATVPAIPGQKRTVQEETDFLPRKRIKAEPQNDINEPDGTFGKKPEAPVEAVRSVIQAIASQGRIHIRLLRELEKALQELKTGLSGQHRFQEAGSGDQALLQHAIADTTQKVQALLRKMTDTVRQGYPAPYPEDNSLHRIIASTPVHAMPDTDSQQHTPVFTSITQQAEIQLDDARRESAFDLTPLVAQYPALLPDNERKKVLKHSGREPVNIADRSYIEVAGKVLEVVRDKDNHSWRLFHPTVAEGQGPSVFWDAQWQIWQGYRVRAWHEDIASEWQTLEGQITGGPVTQEKTQFSPKELTDRTQSRSSSPANTPPAYTTLLSGELPSYEEAQAQEIQTREAVLQATLWQRDTALLKAFTDSLWQGHNYWYELEAQDRALMLKFLTHSEITAVHRHHTDGDIIRNAVNALHERALNQPETLYYLQGRTVLKNMAAGIHRARQDYDDIQHILYATSPELVRLDEASQRMFIDRLLQLKSTLRALNTPPVASRLPDADRPHTAPAHEPVSLLQRVTDTTASVLNPAGKIIFGIGAAAALCRLTDINKKLTADGLGEQEIIRLLYQKNEALRDLYLDGADELGDLTSLNGPKFAETVKKIRAHFNTLNRQGTLPATTSIRKFLTTGIRVTTNLTGPMLAAAGSYFAWCAVHETAMALQEPGLTGERKSELSTDLALAVTSAILSGGMTITGAIGLTAGIGSAFGLASATLTAAATVAGPAGLVMGVALMAVFVAMWIVSGARTVSEVEKYTALTDWERFQTGLGAMFASMPADVQIRYEYEKMVHLVYEQEAARIEAAGLHYRLTDYYGAVNTGNVVPGVWTDSEFYQDFAAGFLFGLGESLLQKTITAAQAHSVFGKIDLNTKSYESTHPDSKSWSVQERKRRMHRHFSGNYLLDMAEIFPDDRVHEHIIPAVKYEKANGIAHFTSLEARLFLNAAGQPSHGIFHADTPLRGDINGDGTEDNLSVAGNGMATVVIAGLPADKQVPLPQDLWQELPDTRDLPGSTGVSLFLHDINSDGRADLIAVHKKSARLRVALGQKDGSLGPVTDDFVISGAPAGQNLFFLDKDIIGFQPGTDRILSAQHVPIGGPGKYYASRIVHARNNTGYALVDFSPKAPGGEDSFVAHREEPGSYLFQVYDTHSQYFTGGQGNDAFYFRLFSAGFIRNILNASADDWPVDIVLDGAGGKDSIVFVQEEKSGRGVIAHLGSRSAPVPSFLRNSARASQCYRLQIMDIENATGTPGDDTLIVHGAWNSTLDGNGGTDTLKGGEGNDTLKITYGLAAGGKGQDTYDLLSTEIPGELCIRENNTAEHSQIWLPDALSRIEAIYQEGIDLCFKLENRNTTISILRLEGFYADIAAGTSASVYDFHSRDGFHFQLTAGKKINHLIEVRYAPEHDSLITTKEVNKTVYRQRSEYSPATLAFYRQDNTRLEQRRLPPWFCMSLQASGKQAVLYGGNDDDILAATAGSGSFMEGNRGSDHYVVGYSRQPGWIYIDNHDDTLHPAEDVLVLPWRFADITWSMQGSDLIATHRFQSRSGIPVEQVVCLKNPEYGRRIPLGVRDIDGKKMHLVRSINEVITLSDGILSTDGSLCMDGSARLSLAWASTGGILLDGRSRQLTGTASESGTIITDNSGQGNKLQGSVQIRNVISAISGNNEMHGGSFADEFYSGSGDDRIDGQEGRDSVQVIAENGHDRLMNIEVVQFAYPLQQQDILCAPHTTNVLTLEFNNNPASSLTFEGYSEDRLKQVELWFSSDDASANTVIRLAELMAAHPARTDRLHDTLATMQISSTTGDSFSILSATDIAGQALPLNTN